MEILNHKLTYLTNLKKKRFVKDVSILAGGTATAQLVTVAFSPIITRFYGPEAFGILGIFNSAVTIIVPIASLAYVYAIVLPASDDDAKSLVKLSFLITAGVFIFSVLIILPFRQQIAHMIGFDAASDYLLLVPLVMVFSSIEEILRQWLIRKREFKSISGIAVVQATSTGSLKSGIGFFYAIAPVLIILNTIGHFLHTFLLWLRAAPTLNIRGEKKAANASGQRESLKKVAYTYRDFPIFRSPQVFINAISQNLPTIMLAALFGPVPAGFYSLSRRVLKLPSKLISKSVGSAFLPRIAEAAKRGQLLRPYILKATSGLALLGLLPFGIVIAFGPWLFEFVFGAEWVRAGEYARWLSVWLYFMFINVPSVQSVPIIGIQKQLLIYEIFSTVLRVGALAFGAYVFISDMWAVVLFSIVGAVSNIVLVIYVIYLSGKLLREDLGDMNE